jgi:membrane protein YfhO
MRSSAAGPLRHAFVVVAGYSALFTWLFSQPIVHGTYMAEGDLYDWFLPIFLSPISAWSHDMFGGLPLFADPSDSQAYVFHFLFAHVLHSWTGYIISAYVLGSAFTYAYVFTVTRSKTAAAVAGLAFGLSHAMLEKQAQINIVHCTAWFPLMALAVDRLINGGSRRWVAIGAIATANCFLSGHPQTILYAVSFCAVYAVAGALAERAPRTFYIRALGMLIIAMAMTAVKSLAFVEVSRYMARTDVSYAWFINPAPSAAQVIAGLLIPPLHDPSKPVSLYVGLAVLELAILGAASRRLAWRARVWACAAVLAVLLVMGDATPVAWLTFHVPLWNKFRIISRILFIFSCSTAVLAGFALAEIQRRERSMRAIAATLTSVVAIVGVAAVVMGVNPIAQLGFAVVSAGFILWLARTQRLALAAALLTAVVAADLLYHVQYTVTAGGFQLTAIRPDDARPSVHARALADAVAPTQQRLLAIGGSSRDATLPSGFTRVWRIPTAGGYSPIMSARLAALAMMGSPGDVYPDVLAAEDRSLDLLAVRNIIVRDNEFPAPETFEASGISWAKPPLDFSIGRSDCGPEYERTASFALSAEVEVTSIAMVVHLRCADNEPQGTEVAWIDVKGADGVQYRRPMRVGIDIADQGLKDDKTRENAQHSLPTVFDDPGVAPYVYLVRVELPQAVRGGRMTIRTAPMRGWLTIDRLTMIDAAGRSMPQTLGSLLLANTDRWRKVTEYRTSRGTDRGSDEERAGEEGSVVYENLRAMPRVWMAATADELPDDRAIETIRYAQFPDGRPFDPMRSVLIEPGVGAQSFTPGPWSAHLVSVEDTRMTVDVSTDHGGYLVLSEAQYPGWRARIDGDIVPVRRVDVMFQGVAVPAGRHTVVFEFASTTLRAGIAISTLAVAFALFLCVPNVRLKADTTAVGSVRL